MKQSNHLYPRLYEMKNEFIYLNGTTPNRPDEFGNIYLLYNPIAHEGYVGKCHGPPHSRFRVHLDHAEYGGTDLYNAIRKYGADIFQLYVIDQARFEILPMKERFWIDYLGTYVDGYNMTAGGEGTAGKHKV